MSLYTDGLQVILNGKKFLRVGSPIEFAAAVKAGYLVYAPLIPVKGKHLTISLDFIIPEVSRYVAVLRDQEIKKPLTDKELIEYVNSHVEFFDSLRTRGSA